MKYTVGAYSISVSEPFKTNDKAVKHIQERYPELSKDEIIKFLKPSIKDADKSENVSQENSEGEKTSAKTNSGGIEKPETRGSK